MGIRVFRNASFYNLAGVSEWKYIYLASAKKAMVTGAGNEHGFTASQQQDKTIP
jgi:hypothetical protein